MLNHPANTVSVRLVCCTVGEETYCLDQPSLLSIERADFLQLNPGSDAPAGWLLGGRDETPVYSLAASIEKPHLQRHTANSRVVMINAEPRWGLLVDSVSRLVETSSSDLLPLPAICQDPALGLFAGAVKNGARLMLLLDPARLRRDKATRQESQPFLPTQSEPESGDDFGPAAFERRNGLTTNWPAGTFARESPDSIHKILLFSTGSSEATGRPILFGLSVRQVLQIADPAPVTPVPAAPSHVTGIFNWHEHAVPLLDVDYCAGLPSASSDPRNRILIVRAPAGGLAGFRVRPGVRVEQVPLPGKSCVPNRQFHNRMVKGLFDLSDQMLIVPDVEAMIARGAGRMSVAAPAAGVGSLTAH
jgi:chemotaxis signal transduction protein